MVDEVVAGERVDEVALAAQVRGGDGHELAVAGRGRELRGPGEQAVAVGGEERRRDEDRRIVARRDASTIAAIAAASPTTSWWSSCSGASAACGQRRGRR